MHINNDTSNDNDLVENDHVSRGCGLIPVGTMAGCPRMSQGPETWSKSWDVEVS